MKIDFEKCSHSEVLALSRTDFRYRRMALIYQPERDTKYLTNSHVFTHMRRRKFAQIGGSLLSIALVGCFGANQPNTNDEPQSDEEETAETNNQQKCNGERTEDNSGSDKEGDNTPEAGFPWLAVDLSPETELPDGVDLTAEITRQYTSSEPATLEVTLRNTENTETEELIFGASPPFSSYRGGHVSEPSALYIAPHDRTHTGIDHVDHEWAASEDPPAPVNDCWTVEAVAKDDIANPSTLEPCKVVSENYSVFAAVENQKCLSEGTYRFRETIAPGHTLSFDVMVSHNNK